MLELSLAALLSILVALTFDFVNGFHDAANSIATVVSTRVLTPRLAVAWAAFWNFMPLPSSAPRWPPRSAQAPSTSAR
jgi:PiT family inorganic phosphate transporter